MRKLINKFFGNKSGATAIEYGLIARGHLGRHHRRRAIHRQSSHRQLIFGSGPPPRPLAHKARGTVFYNASNFLPDTQR